MSALILCLLAGTLLPILAADTENPDVVRPVVIFTPDWRKMFYNETLTMSCLQPSKLQENVTSIWYRNNIRMDVNRQSLTFSSIQLYDRANYQCQTPTSDKSEPVLPLVITDLTILRVSRYVFEGDILTLSCDSRLDMNTTNAIVAFDKNYKSVKPKNSETYLFVGKVDKSVDGKYRCTKKAILKNEEKESDAEELIEMTALFPPPQIKISSYPISIGMVMTLTCETTLHPFRTDTELQFAFYRNGWHVQGFGSLNKYIVQSVQKEDSGDYSCEVRTIMNSVRKTSKQLPILVQEFFKPVVSLYPNWNKAMRLDSVTFTCNDQRDTTISWYKNNVKLYSTGKNLQVYSGDDKDIGNYQCQGESGEKSDPVHMDFFFVWLILQAPLSIHEGDSVTLRCKMWRSGSAVNTTFYKDDNMIQFLGSDSDLKLGTIFTNATGKYKCTRFINTGSVSKVYVAEEYISVAELFTPPEIKLNLHPVVEGADMTLTCHTTISALRQSTTLTYAFYKNGNILQNFSESNKYKLLYAQLEDSGNYACEVKSSSNTVKKRSKDLSINVQGMAVVSFSPNFGKILTTETMTLTCNVDSKIKDKQEFYWYRDSNQMNITQQSFTIQNALVSDSGYYQCRSTNTHMSEPLRLDVSNSDFIVQVPPFIAEGDNLSLVCHDRKGLNLERAEVYKDSSLLKILGSDSDLPLGKALPNMTGLYKCNKNKILSQFTSRTYSTEIFIPIIETFTYLALKVKTTPVIEGNPITLSCDAALNSALNPLRGSTTLEFAFYSNGSLLREFGKDNTYEIKTAMKKDSGNYTCNVKNPINSDVKSSQEIEINVEEYFSTPVLKSSSTKVKTGDQISLSCDYTLHPKRRNMYVKTVIYRDRIVFPITRGLKIYSANSDHSGNYMCEISDVSRSIVKYSNTIYIMVEEPVGGVKISTDQQDLKMLAGSNVTFSCSADRGTSLVFTWFHNEKEIDQNCATYQVLHNGRTLFIQSVQKHHSGFYHCKVNNFFLAAWTEKLEVSVIEPIGGVLLNTDKKVLDVESEESITFTCSLTQGNGSHFFWIHKKQRLEQSTATYEVREGGKVLYIKSVQPRHEGSYQCRAEMDISPKRTLVSESDTLILKISNKGGSYQKPLLIVIVVVSILLISFVLYKYQHKLVIPHFLQGNSQNIRVSVKNIDDKDLLMENIENYERTANSHHH